MIRAEALVRAASTARQRELAAIWSTDAEASAIASAMRSERAAKRLESACSSALMREDLLLLCANPFDTVAPDEVVDATPFERIGLLAATEDGHLEVNADLALTAVRTFPVEFGFAATLLARLPDAERGVVARTVEVGARPSFVDAVLDIASAVTDEAAVMRRVARLTDSQRDVLRQALELGELPDDVSAFPLGSAPPRVTIDPGPAGYAGLAFWVEHPASGVDARPVIPLGLMDRLGDILDQVPPPPEPVASKSRRRSTGTRRAPRKKTLDLSESGASGASGATTVSTSASSSGRFTAPEPQTRRTDPREASGGMSVFRDSLAASGGSTALTASGAMTPYRLGRVRSVRAGSAIVDVETGKVAEAVLRDSRLAGDVLEVLSDSLVVLQPGVDARAWAELCALRLGL